MAIPYTPPGVTVREVTSPSVSPLLAAPAVVCLVGRAAGFQTKTEAITLTGTTAVTLQGVPTDATMASGAIQKVMDATTPSLAPDGYVVTTDYTFSNSAHTITRVGAGAIPDGATVYVTYQYTVKDYFQAIRLDNQSDVEDRFGPSWDSTGTAISSRLSHAASIAFENGAQELVLQPLYKISSGARVAPSDSEAANSSNWTDTLISLRDVTDVNVVVPIVGQADPSVGDSNQLSIIQTVQDHVKFQKDQQEYVVMVVAEDSSASTSVATTATVRTHATTLAARYGGEVTEQVAFLSPSRYPRALPLTNGTIVVGGQYAAAAVAGALAARPVSATLTRQPISGFTGVGEFRSKADKNLDAATGLMVLEQKGHNVVVRHAITLNITGGTIKRELSIVRAKHRVIESVRDTIDTQIIGKVIADGNAPTVVRTAVISVLAQLQDIDDIVDFSDVQARTLQLDPTTIEVRFSYLPAFPVNYVNIIFSLDLTNGTLTVPNANQVDTGV